MIDKINNQMNNYLEGVQPNRSNNNTPKSAEQEVSLDADFSSLVQKAINADGAGPDAVQNAKDLLSTGKIGSPQMIRSAAEAIIKHGF